MAPECVAINYRVQASTIHNEHHVPSWGPEGVQTGGDSDAILINRICRRTKVDCPTVDEGLDLCHIVTSHVARSLPADLECWHNKHQHQEEETQLLEALETHVIKLL